MTYSVWERSTKKPGSIQQIPKFNTKNNNHQPIILIKYLLNVPTGKHSIL